VGVSELIESLRHIKEPAPSPRTIGPCGTCGGCRFQSRYAWTDSVASRCSHAPSASRKTPTEFLDRVLTHPVLGMTVLMAVMVGLFYLIFKIAAVPMDWIDAMFAGVGAWLNARLPESEWRDLLVQGILGGVGGVLVFLPQICILFFCLTLLEDTGYLARAAFAMDRFMHKAGLPGQAFVPLLSAHACAIPALMATRVIADNRDRLVTILITPLMSCSARIPVYSMLAALLFPREPAKAALVFTGAYALGLGIALAMAFAFKKTLLQGEAAPLLMELPALKWPSLRTALLTVTDRALLFARKAGGVILLVSILLWTLSTYPKCEPPLEAHALQQQAEAAMAHGDLAGAEELEARANRITSHHALAQSAAGRLGKIIEPGLRPLGFDWQIGIGILSSFAAREVIVSTLSVIYGMGEEVENLSALSDSLRQATRPDGHPVFTPATSASLLVFFVIAMQCLPTLAVTRRETNSWKWPLFQLFYLSALAYLASFVVYNGLWLL
ncbi:MAG TPA: ferrous iron transporter B, partial [Candidatus Paceibacterota bacterium]|nr:ferrous iron transporter B [Candidatus Paceibacterota bacterium]